MGSHLVIVLSPLIDPFLGVLQGPEPMLIQTFIAELSVQVRLREPRGKQALVTRRVAASGLFWQRKLEGLTAH